MKDTFSKTIRLSFLLMFLVVGCGGKMKLPPQPIHGTPSLARERARQGEQELEQKLTPATKPPTEGESSPTKPVQVSPASSPPTRPLPNPFTESTWVEATGEAYAQGKTGEEAQQLALANAYQNAIAIAAGVHVNVTETRIVTETNTDFLDAFIQISRTDVRGHVTQANVLQWEPASIPSPSGDAPLIGYRVRLRALVNPPKGERDTGFRVKAELNNETFREGEDIILRVTTTRDAFLTLFNFVSDGQVFLLVPSDVLASVPLKAHVESEIPLPEQRSQGIHLRARLPGEAKGTTESFLIVAIREPIPLPKLKEKGQLTILDVNRWLASIPLEERAEDVVAFDIRRK